MVRKNGFSLAGKAREKRDVKGREAEEKREAQKRRGEEIRDEREQKREESEARAKRKESSQKFLFRTGPRPSFSGTSMPPMSVVVPASHMSSLWSSITYDVIISHQDTITSSYGCILLLFSRIPYRAHAKSPSASDSQSTASR